MPDYLRIGPAYGQVNELIRGQFWQGGVATADIQRFGAAGPWAADNWQPVPSNINPGTGVASWAIVPFMNDLSPFGAQITSGEGIWTIYNATSMPPSAIIARATVKMPYVPTAMFVFEMVAAATFAAFPVVPEFALNGANSVRSQFVASAQGSVLGGSAPPTGSFMTSDFSRAYAQALFDPANFGLGGIDEVSWVASTQYQTIQIRTVGSVASGALLQIRQLRLAALPIAWATNAGAAASAAILLASAYVGTFYTMANRGIFTGDVLMSRVARFPAMPQWDGNQPEGRAYEVGSTSVAGQVEWGSDLVQQNFAQSQLTPGDPFAFEKIPNRTMKVPYIYRDASLNPYMWARNLERVMAPGNVVDVVPEFSMAASQYVTRFDLVEGRALYTEDIRYSRAGIARGTLELTTQPYGRSASMIGFSIGGGASYAGILGGTQSYAFYFAGDVPAPLTLTHQLVFGGIASGASGQNVPAIAFMAIITPADKIASYYPLLLNASFAAGAAAASAANGYRPGGSQIQLPMLNTNLANGGVGPLNPAQSGAFTQRTRIFAVAGNASAATIPIQFGINLGGDTAVSQATVLSNIGYITPLNTAASEMMQLGYVDLGEVRLPNNTIGYASTNQWYVQSVTGPSSNASAGVFDSILAFPVGDPRTWFGIIASRAIATIGNLLMWTASNVLQGPSQAQPNLYSGSQAQIDFQSKMMSVDIGGNAQGKPPYVSPGWNHVYVAPIAISPTSTRIRPFSMPSNADAITGAYYPRFVFIAGR